MNLQPAVYKTAALPIELRQPPADYEIDDPDVSTDSRSFFSWSATGLPGVVSDRGALGYAHWWHIVGMVRFRNGHDTVWLVPKRVLSRSQCRPWSTERRLSVRDFSDVQDPAPNSRNMVRRGCH